MSVVVQSVVFGMKWMEVVVDRERIVVVVIRNIF